MREGRSLVIQLNAVFFGSSESGSSKKLSVALVYYIAEPKTDLQIYFWKLFPTSYSEALNQTEVVKNKKVMLLIVPLFMHLLVQQLFKISKEFSLFK